MATLYTAITFSPVQEFIEKSRKLRDLYGSSFILSYLSNRLYKEAESKGFKVISPAMIGVAQGSPNFIIIKGDFSQDAEKIFNEAWGNIVDRSRSWIEDNIKQTTGQTYEYLAWKRYWDAWKNHAWEFFCVVKEAETISDVKIALNEKKRSRNWIGINWTGESSTLSGADGIAWYGMGSSAPKNRSMGAEDIAIKSFYQSLSKEVEESIISPREQLSIPELIKRLITLERVAVKHIKIKPEELPKSFRDLNRHRENISDREEASNDSEIFTEIIREDDEQGKKSRYSGWFLGDGDNAGIYLKTLSATEITKFSLAMRKWGQEFDRSLPKSPQQCNLVKQDGTTIKKYLHRSDGRIIYAGGDDFLGVLYRNHPNPELTGYDCIKWFYQFESEQNDTIWKQHKQPITVSVGFVWTGAKVPQREVLQHCRDAEKAAKKNGRDRLAIRILFNSGNYLEWICPWWFLNILKNYRDRHNISGIKANWTHIYNDVAVLESRHAFQGNKDIALELFEIYFGKEQKEKLEDDLNLWNRNTEVSDIKNTKKLRGGILGEKSHYLVSSEEIDPNKRDSDITNWIINLAKVGFHLCRQQ